jgi:predicted amidohydrolase YtcJ
MPPFHLFGSRSGTEEIDLKGKMVLPGFIDSNTGFFLIAWLPMEV